MSLVLEALGIDLVDGLGAGRPRREPAVGGDDLDAANRRVVTGSAVVLAEDRLAGERSRLDRLRGYLPQPRLLLGRCRSVDPCVERRAELLGKATVMLAGLLAGAGGDLGRQQIHDQPVLVGRPDAAIVPQKTGAGTFLAAEAARAVEESGDKPLEPDRHFLQSASQLFRYAIDHAAADQRLADRGTARPARAVRQQIGDGDSQIVIGV